MLLGATGTVGIKYASSKSHYIFFFFWQKIYRVYIFIECITIVSKFGTPVCYSYHQLRTAANIVSMEK